MCGTIRPDEADDAGGGDRSADTQADAENDEPLQAALIDTHRARGLFAECQGIERTAGECDEQLPSSATGSVMRTSSQLRSVSAPRAT